MFKKSIFYRSPRLYIWGLNLIHGQNLKKRYSYIASFIKKGETVLEPGCGPALLAKFLAKGSSYRGFDGNKIFVNYDQKRHLQVLEGDVFDFTNYSPADVVVVCDVLHHLPLAKRGEFIRYCWQTVKKKLIICDPWREKIPEKGWHSWLKKWAFTYSELDGTNRPKLLEVWTKKELREKMEKGFGVIPLNISRTIKEIGEDFIVVYEKI